MDVYAGVDVDLADGAGFLETLGAAAGKAHPSVTTTLPRTSILSVAARIEEVAGAAGPAAGHVDRFAAEITGDPGEGGKAGGLACTLLPSGEQAETGTLR